VLGIIINCSRFFAELITPDGRKFFDSRKNFNSIKSEYMIFSIPELYGGTEKFPIDLDIP